MKYTDIEFVLLNGIPAIDLKINGIGVIILPHQKPWLVKNNLLAVLCEPGTRGLLPPAWIPADPRGRGPRVGWWSLPDSIVADPVLVQLYQALLTARKKGTFQPGPVDLPEKKS